MIRRTNKYIDQTEPWVLGKDKNKKERLEQVLYNLAESLRIISILVYSFIPETALKMWYQLGIKDDLENMEIPEKTDWGTPAFGTKVNPGANLFPRIEETKKSAPEETEERGVRVEKVTMETNNKKQELPTISIEDFQKLDLRVGKVISAEGVTGTNKLLKIEVDFKSEIRTLIAGIKEFYLPEELIGKNIVVVFNLAPSTIRGIQSQGMLLAASDGEQVVLLTSDKEISPGSKIR